MAAFQPILRYSLWESVYPIDPELWVLDQAPNTDWAQSGRRFGTKLIRTPAVPFKPDEKNVRAGNAAGLTLPPNATIPPISIDADFDHGIGSPQ